MSVPKVEVVCNLMMSGEAEEFYRHIKINRQYCRGPQDVVQAQSHRGQSVAICGAGPSLTGANLAGYDEVWGCNRALPYLVDRALPVTHGFAIDQGIDMLKPSEWRRIFPVRYMLGSSVHPLLTRKIHRKGRPIVWFHNYLGMGNPLGWVDPPTWKKPEGMKDNPNYTGKELYLYCSLWPSTVQAGYGLNAVPRAICVALWMGFARIDVFGADCAAQPDNPTMPHQGDQARYVAWLKDIQLYASGESVLDTYGPNAIMVEHELGHHRWHTRPDMLISARHLVDMVRAFNQVRTDAHGTMHGVIRLVGDTLPATMAQIPPEHDYWKTVPNLNGQGGITGFGAHPDLLAEMAAAS